MWVGKVPAMDTLPATLCAVLVITALHLQGALALRMLELQVPAAILRGQPALLNCTFDIEGDVLYSVKWYKNNVEFFRYIPGDDLPGQVYPSRGIHLDTDFRQGSSVLLHKTDLESEGTYRCEVSAESPSFQTVMDQKEMRVYVLPERGPTILGSKSKYQIGDELNVTCMSAASKPPSFLQWQVNGREVSQQLISRMSPLKYPDGLLSSMLGLRFLVEPGHLRGGALTLRCAAFIAKAYLITRTEVVATNKAKAAQPHNTPSEDGPRISGDRLRYQEGNVVNVNCTAVPAHPPAELRWYINDKEANADYLRPYGPLRYPDGQESSVLGLRFTVKPLHFAKSEMRLKCAATLFQVTRMRSEDMVVSSRKQSSGLHVSVNRNGVRNCGCIADRRYSWLLTSLPLLTLLLHFR